MGNRLSYLMKNTSIFAIGEMGTKLINFFLVPFYTNVLTTEEYGTVDLLFTVCTVLVPLVMFNIGEALMRYALDEDADHEKLLSIALTAVGFGVVISALIIPISSLFPLVSGYGGYLYLYVVLCATKSVVTSYLRGREQLKLYVACNLLNTLLIAVFNILFLLVFHMGIEGYLRAYILAEAVAIFFGVLAGQMYKVVRRFRLDWQLAKKMIFFSLAVVPNSLLWWVINSSDRIMVTAMRGVAENGLLAVGYKLPSVLTMVNTILMQAWKYSAIKERESADRDAFTNRMLDQFLRASVLIAAAMLMLLRPMTRLLFAASYYDSWRSSAFLLVGFVFMGISTFVGTAYYVEKNMVGNMLSALVGAVVNLALNAVLIPVMGAAGATLAACICYVVILLYRYLDTRKYQTLRLFQPAYLLLFGLLFVMAFGLLTDCLPGTVAAVAACVGIAAVNLSYLRELFRRGWGIVKAYLPK